MDFNFLLATGVNTITPSDVFDYSVYNEVGPPAESIQTNLPILHMFRVLIGGVEVYKSSGWDANDYFAQTNLEVILADDGYGGYIVQSETIPNNVIIPLQNNGGFISGQYEIQFKSEIPIDVEDAPGQLVYKSGSVFFTLGDASGGIVFPTPSIQVNADCFNDEITITDSTDFLGLTVDFVDRDLTLIYPPLPIVPDETESSSSTASFSVTGEISTSGVYSWIASGSAEVSAGGGVFFLWTYETSNSFEVDCATTCDFTKSFECLLKKVEAARCGRKVNYDALLNKSMMASMYITALNSSINCGNNELRKLAIKNLRLILDDCNCGCGK